VVSAIRRAGEHNVLIDTAPPPQLASPGPIFGSWVSVPFDPFDLAERERQLQVEREQLRALVELSNAVAPARDLASLLTAIPPHLQRVVLHDAASIYLLEDGGQGAHRARHSRRREVPRSVARHGELRHLARGTPGKRMVRA
jgi:hypothetical protein